MTNLFDRLPIAESICASKLSFKFEGPDLHLAPVGVTPLSEALKGMTNAAHITLIAGLVIVCARRLERLADTRRLHFLAECLLCYERSPLYYSGYRRPKPEKAPGKAEQVVSEIFKKSTAVFMQTLKRHSNAPPVPATKNVAELAKLVLGPENADYLNGFLRVSIEHLHAVAPNASPFYGTLSDYDDAATFEAAIRRNFGSPVPIEVLDGARDPKELDLTALYQKFLSEVDWRENPYLTPTKAMIEQGFVGDPYPVGR